MGRGPRRARRRAARRRPARVLPRTTCARPAATGRTCSPSPRRRSSPRRPSPGAQRVGRLFDEQTSDDHASTLDGRRCCRSKRACRCLGVARPRRPREPRPPRSPRGSQPGLRTRAFVFNTLLADKATDDRLRSLPDAGSRAATSPTRRATSRCRRSSTRCRRRYDIPQRWYALKAQLLGVDRLADYDRMASRRRRARPEFGWAEAKELVLDAYASFSPRARRRRAPASSTSAGSTRRCARASDPARSAPTPCRRTTRTCCSTGRRAAATCSRSPTSSATACTRTSPASRACSTRRRR